MKTEKKPFKMQSSEPSSDLETSCKLQRPGLHLILMRRAATRLVTVYPEIMGR